MQWINLISLEIPMHKSTWYNIPGIYKAANPATPFMFLGTDWLLWRAESKTMDMGFCSSAKMASYVLMHFKVYLVFGLLKQAVKSTF